MRSGLPLRAAAPLCGVWCLLVGCAFPDQVSVGKDVTQGGAPGIVAAATGGNAGDSGGNQAVPSAGASGTGGMAATDPHMVPTEQVGACSMGVEVATGWIATQQSAGEMGAGSGGDLVAGTYLLSRLVLHGSSACFDTSVGVAQTLALFDGRGQVVSKDETGRRWASQFEYSLQDNSIVVARVCEQGKAEGAGSESAPFGPFQTYTANADTLILFSTSCSYRAEYLLTEVPAR